MIWASISLEAHTDLVFVENGAMTAHRHPGMCRISCGSLCAIYWREFSFYG
jgi:hypothetical protein